MRKHTSILFIIFSLITLGCNESGFKNNEDPSTIEENSASLRGGISLNFCETTQKTTNGTLCAIQPSRTGPNIKDFAHEGNRFLGHGFGYHAIGVPHNYSKDSSRGVWLHFGGTYGKPYDPSDDNFASETFLDEIMEQGYLVFQVAYDNEKSINGYYCAPGSKGSNLDWCAASVREEILIGNNLSDIISVDYANSYTHRLFRLMRYLSRRAFPLPSDFNHRRTEFQIISNANLSGHSQGAGHAYFLAKYIGSKGVCFLGGPYDTPDRVNLDPNHLIANWFLDDSRNQTPVQNMGALVVTDDSGYESFVHAYGYMGLNKNRQWFEARPARGGRYTNKNGETITDGHAASVGAVELKEMRARACF